MSNDNIQVRNNVEASTSTTTIANQEISKKPFDKQNTITMKPQPQCKHHSHPNKEVQETPSSIENLNNYQLQPQEEKLLNKGFNFIPTPNKEHTANNPSRFPLYDRRLRLKHHFIKKEK
jgi:quercetin dioxygenase-like cupin family protein